MDNKIAALWQEIRPNAIWDGIKWLFGWAMRLLVIGVVVVVSLIALFFPYVMQYPRESLLKALVSICIGVSWFLMMTLAGVYLFRKSKDKRSEGAYIAKIDSIKASHQLRVVCLEEMISLLGAEKTQLLNQVDQLAIENDQLKRFRWAHPIILRQAEHIKPFIKVSNITLNKANLSDEIPSIKFYLWLKNESLFTVRFELKKNSRIKFLRVPLHYDMVIIDADYESLANDQSGYIAIKQPITKEEAIPIASRGGTDTGFSFESVGFTILSDSKIPIEERTIDFHSAVISEG